MRRSIRKKQTGRRHRETETESREWPCGPWSRQNRGSQSNLLLHFLFLFICSPGKFQICVRESNTIALLPRPPYPPRGFSHHQLRARLVSSLSLLTHLLDSLLLINFWCIYNIFAMTHSLIRDPCTAELIIIIFQLLKQFFFFSRNLPNFSLLTPYIYIFYCGEICRI